MIKPGDWVVLSPNYNDYEWQKKQAHECGVRFPRKVLYQCNRTSQVYNKELCLVGFPTKALCKIPKQS